MIYESFITNKALIYNYDEPGTILDLDENGNLVATNEDAEMAAAIAGVAVPFVACAVIIAVCSIKAKKDKKIINKALRGYEKENPDVIPVSKMTYRVYKLKKNLSFSNNADVKTKGKEDLGNIFEKMFKGKVKDTKINRIVEYFYEGKPVMAVAYTCDTTSDGYTTTYNYVCNVSFATQEFAKHSDYYTVKLCIDRGFYAKEADSFVSKYGNNSDDDDEE